MTVAPNRSLSLVAVLAACVLLPACGVRTSYAPLNASPHPVRLRQAADVPVLLRPPPQPHVEIAVLEAQRRSQNHATRQELYQTLRDLGAGRGCEAVRVVGPLSGSNFGLRATCVVLIAPVSAQASPTGAPASTALASAAGG